ncbi:MAG: YqaJ viral recombinase family protein, partial [Desulfobulbaceae bacterium]|nr:YqaJ viral recombinase family protein [Desulfobulbaceae bacterium]
MKQHEEMPQGSQAWHEHRRTHFNASDAPAMLGLSKYKSRTQLIHELATGITKDVDQATQRLFDRGHRFEALARPLAEEIIGKKLYPVVGSDGNFSASFDGLTMCETINFEHKTLNAELRRIFAAGEPLPEMYTSQIEQQHMVSGAEKTLFMASEWDDYGNLLEEHHCWCFPDMAMRERILAGWSQFEKDLAEYVPAEVVIAPVAETTESLPALSIQTSGAISIQSNLAVFGQKLSEFVGQLNLKPETDQDFANAEAAVKVLANAQTALETAEAQALAQASDVDEMRRTVAAYAKTARDTRLMLEKVIKA